jgi:hypothetical protein
MIDTMIELFKRDTYLNVFSKNSQTTDLYNRSNIVPTFLDDKGQPNEGNTIGQLDDSMVDVFGKLWMQYSWPSSTWHTQDCKTRKPTKPNMIEITDCRGGITIRAMREFFSQTMAPVLVPFVGSDFAGARAILDFADSNIPPQVWSKIGELKTSSSSYLLRPLDNILNKMRDMFNFRGLGDQFGPYILPFVDDWRLFVVKKRMAWPGMAAPEFQVDRRMQ